MNQATRKQWTDEMIEADIRAISKEVGSFPSAAELRHLGRNDLAGQISRRGGFREWANRTGIPHKHSDSDFGWQGEDTFVDLCIRQELPARRVKGVKSPWDIEISDTLRVDVKTANYAEYGSSRGWFYRIAKRPQADIVVLLQHDTDDFYGIPWWVCPSSNITISRCGGKYAKYLNNWALIRQMIGMRLGERARLSSEAITDVA